MWDTPKAQGGFAGTKDDENEVKVSDDENCNGEKGA